MNSSCFFQILFLLCDKKIKEKYLENKKKRQTLPTLRSPSMKKGTQDDFGTFSTLFSITFMKNAKKKK